MDRPLGFVVFKTYGVKSPEIEYVKPTSEAYYVGGVVKQGSTMGGNVGALTTGNLGVDIRKCFILQASPTAGTSNTNYPAIRINDEILFLVGHASSNSTSAISSTYVGQAVCPCSSGTAVLAGTTGQFRITAVFNTSDYTNQVFAGQFIRTATTN